VRPYLEKNPSQKRTGGVAQGVSPEYPSTTKREKKSLEVRHQWFTPVILATQEAKIMRIGVRSQLKENNL
jgi:hypothetical protein